MQPVRAPLRQRNRALRQAARRRVAARTVRRVEPGPDPLRHGGRSLPARLAKGALALAASTTLHAAVVVLGVVIGGLQLGRRGELRQTVEVEVRERQPPPPPPRAEPPPPEKPRAPVAPRRAAPEPEPPPPEPKAPPPPRDAPPPRTQPKRVVGLSYESTSEGGSGPAFAVGNTREGKTERKAEAPREVPREPGTGTAMGPDAPPANKTATRLPTAGARYVLPKRKRPSVPAYPATLKSQGVEADVTVMVTIDAAGKVTGVKIIRPAREEEFNEAARRAALAEAFEPATKDGAAIPYTLSFTYRFRLEDQ